MCSVAIYKQRTDAKWPTFERLHVQNNVLPCLCLLWYMTLLFIDWVEHNCSLIILATDIKKKMLQKSYNWRYMGSYCTSSLTFKDPTPTDFPLFHD